MDVKKEISDFINSNETGGALLLTGKWGCGKTYLLREIENELNAGNEFAVVLVSLFGIQSVEQLNKKVKEKIFHSQYLQKSANEVVKKINPIKRCVESISSVISDYSKIAKGINTALSVNLYDFVVPSAKIKIYQNKKSVSKRLVLVFDDLERCNVDSVEMLGAINEYVENIGIKTIILAEEKFITADDNKDGKKYKEFKEKVISRTVQLISDYSNIISAIVNNYKETADGYVSFLKVNIDLLIQVFSESEHENLRSFKSYIIDFERIYRVWKDSNIPTDEMPNVLYAFGAIYFEYRANNIKKEANIYCFEAQNTANKYSKLNHAYLLSQFEAWIVDGIWDEQALIDALSVRFLTKNVEDYELFLNCDFWSLNDDIIAKGLPEALDLAYCGALCSNDLISLLARVLILNENKILLPCEIDYQRLSSGFKSREDAIKNGNIVEHGITTFLAPEQVSKLCESARVLYHEIDKFDYRKVAWACRRDFLSYLKNSGSLDNYNLRGKSLVSFDDELLACFISAFRMAENSKKREIFQTINNITFDSKYVSRKQDIVETVNNLHKLVEALSEIYEEEKDSFTRYIIKETIKNVNEMEIEIEKHITTINS